MIRPKIRSSQLRSGLASTGLALLCACAATTSSDPALDQANAAMSRQDYRLAASDYAAVARDSSGSGAVDAWLKSAQASLAVGDATGVDAALNSIPPQVSDAHQVARAQLLRGEAALARHDPAAALLAIPEHPTDPTDAATMLSVRAEALQLRGDSIGATAALVARETKLPMDQIAANRAQIWKTLLGAAPNQLSAQSSTRLAASDVITRGWVELAHLARSGAHLQDYEAWQKRYPNHPAAGQLDSLLAGNGPNPLAQRGASLPAAAAAQILAAGSGGAVLLLPTSGGIASASSAIEAGFNEVEQSRTVDAGTEPASAVEAYRSVVAAGGGSVIGPLRKEGVAALATSGNIGIPVIALNHLDPGQPAPAGFWQFGLAPEDEARSAASDAIARGLNRAAVLVPENTWGNQLAQAFRQQLESQQGVVVATGTYPAGNDYSAAIQSLLKLDASEARAHSIATTLGLKPEFEPRARTDIDFIFIAARSAQAQLLVPQLRFFHADQLPIYATSSVYLGAGDMDLSGVRFCDVPALLSDAPADGSADIVRLHALGHDAALLDGAIRAGKLNSDSQIDGATGRLSVGSNNVILRGLACAEITANGVRALPAP